jgi:hypothetical protein
LKKQKIETSYDVKMNKLEHEFALIEIRTIANGFGEKKNDLEKLQAIGNIATQWEENFLNSLLITKKSKFNKINVEKISKKESIKIKKHLKSCKIRTCVVCKSMRSDLKRMGKK